MSNLRKAAEMVLEAWGWDWSEPRNEALKERMEALRQALAQPEQEPVVGMFEEKLPDQNPPPWSRSYRLKRDWVGLTDEEINHTPVRFTMINGPGDYLLPFARAVEAKLKEKNT